MARSRGSRDCICQGLTRGRGRAWSLGTRLNRGIGWSPRGGTYWTACPSGGRCLTGCLPRRSRGCRGSCRGSRTCTRPCDGRCICSTGGLGLGSCLGLGSRAGLGDCSSNCIRGCLGSSACRRSRLIGSQSACTRGGLRSSSRHRVRPCVSWRGRSCSCEGLGWRRGGGGCL